MIIRSGLHGREQGRRCQSALALTAVDASARIPVMSSLPMRGHFFAAFPGCNPIRILPGTFAVSVMQTISPAAVAILIGKTWFPTTLAQAFMSSLRLTFYIGAGISLIAALLSALRGAVYINEFEAERVGVSPPPKRSFMKRKRE